MKTFLRTVQPYGNAMLNKIQSMLSSMNHTCVTLDNNQKGHPLKYQRFGSSNQFVKVTARMICECVCCETIISGHVPLTYVNQVIPSPVGLPTFSSLNIHRISNEFITEISDASNANIDQEIDFSGQRVNSYISMVNIAVNLCSQMQFLTGYNNKTELYKYWTHQPDQFKTDT